MRTVVPSLWLIMGTHKSHSSHHNETQLDFLLGELLSYFLKRNRVKMVGANLKWCVEPDMVQFSEMSDAI
ncbi:hypothetical protein VR7878_00129 [Vibrio ruber DSM 16370]|uniref:Uncharacterized protein n=1 Tax=Vibrio ruber (strain DSM 16370 / JCM 11486 / BCRC 17186 / CECT 7878 / LMG 23124 / VR1) TaxID=1123498 RepID=A0A1R4L8R4_VIBR1|nr:hypothetical protein VR7878_00129 [Vibrio ruber DSM 16370]